MRRLLLSTVVMLFMAIGVQAQTAPDAAELTKLLNDFLAGASRNDAAMHDRFWAEDLIYTGSAGRRNGKAEILRNLRSAPAPKPGDVLPVYSAEEVRIQQYGDTAIVAFRLVSTTKREGATEIASYLNSGTFLKRNGKWQVVNWQSTRLPRSEEESKKEVTMLDATLHQALLTADVKKLATLIDDNFIWTHSKGDQQTRQQLLDQLSSGQLKYAKLENSKVTIAIAGDTAIVRGASTRQRSAVPGSVADANSFPVFYTLTLVNRGGAWKAIAMHTSRSN